jgi:hypothetical protein
MVEPGGVCVWRGPRVWSQAVGTFGRYLASVIVNVFSHLIFFIKEFYKLCAFMRFAKIMLQLTVLLFNTQFHSRQLRRAIRVLQV